jgi:hypothetical protein
VLPKSAYAAPPNLLPEDPNLYYGVSSGTKNGVGNNLLYSPVVWIKVYAGTNDGTTVTFINGNHCPNTAGYDSATTGTTKFELHSVNSEEKYFFYNGVTVNSSVNNTTNPAACGNVTMNIPAGKLTESEVDGHVSPFGTKLFVGLIKVYMQPYSPTTNGPLNAFRVSASGAYIGGWAQEPTDSQTSGEPTGRNTVTILGRPNTGSNTPTDDYELKFKPPCTFFGGGLNPANKNVYLKWRDDDSGSGYQPNFTMKLYEQNEGSSGIGTLVKTITTRSAEGAYASESITVKPHKKYIWRWEGITRRNGVQVYYPFDSGDYDFVCPSFTDASCTIVDSTAANGVPDQVKAGSTFDVTMVVGNSGTTSWGNTYYLGSGADSSPSSDPKGHDNNFWKAAGNGNNAVSTPVGNRVTLTNYPVPGSGGSQDPSFVLPALRIVKFKVTAPATGGNYPFWWQVVQAGVAWRGEPCKKTIEVVEQRNRPFIGVMGGDVISGARFGSTELGASASCTATDDAKKAPIKTNGYYGDAAAMFKGSSVAQYGVFASGAIGDDNNYSASNTFLGDFGYNRPQTDDTSKDALFANTNLENREYGNFYKEISDPPLPCVDIRTLQSAGAATPISGATAINAFLDSSTESGVRLVNGGSNVTIAARQIPAGTRKTLITSGNVTISGNITYGDSYASEKDIPYLNIIGGNIYIQVNAQRVDASLTAMPSKDPVEPNNTAKQANGIIDTCSNMSGTTAGTWPASLVTTSCRRTPNSFVLNGKLIARRILWKRTSGTLSYKDTAIDPICYYANYGDGADTPVITGPDSAIARMQQCASELIRFNAEAYLSNFSSGVTVDSVPKSTTELPPIY